PFTVADLAGDVAFGVVEGFHPDRIGHARAEQEISGHGIARAPDALANPQQELSPIEEGELVLPHVAPEDFAAPVHPNRLLGDEERAGIEAPDGVEAAVQHLAARPVRRLVVIAPDARRLRSLVPAVGERDAVLIGVFPGADPAHDAALGSAQRPKIRAPAPLIDVAAYRRVTGGDGDPLGADRDLDRFGAAHAGSLPSTWQRYTWLCPVRSDVNVTRFPVRSKEG